MESMVQQAVQKSKIFFKALMIGGLILLLLIPAMLVENLVKEREERQKEAFDEVSSKWAGTQNVTGPVLVLPYNEAVTNSSGAVVHLRKQAYILPDKLTVEGDLRPEERHRGIYQVMLYSSALNISGQFNSIPLKELRIDPSNVLWNEAHVCVDLQDARGLKEEMQLKWNDSVVTLNPATVDNAVMKKAFTAPVTVNPDGRISFSSTLQFNGSRELLFTPVGRETTVKVNSTWPEPSFTGGQLPDHKVSKEGFTATWKSLSHTRTFPQAWKETSYNLEGASFGTALFIPVNGYQKTMRSVKYAILCIVLTFAAFFIIEMVNKRSVHPIQYGLVGVALLMFYTLLLSFSEYIGFNMAYVVATVATVGLIGWFVKGVLSSGKLSWLLSILLVLLYGYVFTILQLQDYSLLLGSIGLFATLAVIMHFCRKIQW
ncbi:cell envelope integrity protein CreD [Terrimonas sp. NA20]|uniref:Cell envelope integrity protein CreD n=1 Tax=Terrimonas ginsenosidimutans TaxID=2908004 RepID=A0ABS9KZW4_9BACT|nr:cell envelope integrity protein CreD [Terrimonas ginsenosidimutans]MCG2617875.1 cell envelope integrity protein CreD [Terrimonas ginsenosidimutans]